jgi:hypothetical protein
MLPVVLEQTVARKRNTEPHRKSGPAEPIGRVEFQADPAWIRKVEAAAHAIGLSKSAYIRLAVNRQMAADKRDQDGP